MLWLDTTLCHPFVPLACMQWGFTDLDQLYMYTGCSPALRAAVVLQLAPGAQ
jgi:hypothetical protein